MATMALTADGNFYARFFIETGFPAVDLCASEPWTASYGGGSTFDCYSTNTNVVSLPLAGTGIGPWVFGDGTVNGDTFDTYAAESPLVSQITGSGLSGWRFG